MENPKFYPSDAIIYGLTTAINNIRLLMLSQLAFWGGLIAGFMLVSIPCLALIQHLTHKSYLIQGWFFSFDYLQFQNDISTFEFYTMTVLILGMCSYLFIVYSLMAGYLRMIFNFYDTGSTSISYVFSTWDRSLPLFLVTILYGLIVLSGLSLFIVPGIYWAIRFIFSLLIVAEKNCGVIDALKESYKITEGHEWHIFALYIAMSLIITNPFLRLMMGFPLLLVYTYAYKHCKQ